MKRNYSFAGKVIPKKNNKDPDFPQPDKFFYQLNEILEVLKSAPFSAIEDLSSSYYNRDILLNIIKQSLKILRVANIDLNKELQRLNEDPFDGLEEDLKKN